MLVVASAFLIPPTTDLQPERDMAESFRPCLYSQAVKLFLVALQFALGLLNSCVVLSLGIGELYNIRMHPILAFSHYNFPETQNFSSQFA